MGRISHNMALIKALVCAPLAQLASTALYVLSWELPILSGCTFALLQGLALNEGLVYLPAIFIVGLGANVLWISQQRLRYIEAQGFGSGGGTASPVVDAPLEYIFKNQSLREKARKMK